MCGTWQLLHLSCSGTLSAPNAWVSVWQDSQDFTRAPLFDSVGCGVWHFRQASWPWKIAVFGTVFAAGVRKMRDTAPASVPASSVVSRACRSS